MGSNLWLIGLSLLSNILIALALLSYAWIYFDAFLSQNDRKDIFRSFGGILLFGYFILNVLNFNQELGNISIVQLLIFTLGLFSIFYGNLLEPVPGLPNSDDTKKLSPLNYIAIVLVVITAAVLSYLNTIPEYNKPIIGLSLLLFILILIYVVTFRKGLLHPDSIAKREKSFKRQRSLSVFLLIIPFFTAPLLSIIITIQNFKKVFDGMSKEFKSLAIFWVLFSFYSGFQTLSLLGRNYFIFIDVFTRRYSVLWIASQILLIICAYFVFKWIAFFISFRIIARIFLYIWQICIVLTIFLASGYSVLLIGSFEGQINELLNKNANLIQYSFDQLRQNNLTALNLLVTQSNIKTALAANDISGIDQTISTYIKRDESTDKVQVINPEGVLIYDSEDPTLEGIVLTDNSIIKSTLYFREELSAFVAEEPRAGDWVLSYQFAYPIVEDNGQLLGIVTTYKRVDDNYLDLIKRQTSQELIVYVNQKRTASTILQSDNVTRAENIPLVTENLISQSGNISFYRARLLTTPYYLAVIDVKDVGNNKFANIVIGTKQPLLIEVAEKSLFQVFLLSLALTLASTVPSYFLARNLNKSMKV